MSDVPAKPLTLEEAMDNAQAFFAELTGEEKAERRRILAEIDMIETKRNHLRARLKGIKNDVEARLENKEL